MAKLKKSPPWQTYYDELTALFGEDPDIQILYDEDKQEIKMYVDNADKADALAALLPSVQEFGNVKLKVNIVPGNARFGVDDTKPPFEVAFAGNPVVSFIEKTAGIFEATYVVFVNEVVQYFDDNIGDIHGMQSTLYQDIAKRIFPDAKGVFFCTDLPGMPVDELLGLLDCIEDDEE